MVLESRKGLDGVKEIEYHGNGFSSHHEMEVEQLPTEEEQVEEEVLPSNGLAGLSLEDPYAHQQQYEQHETVQEEEEHFAEPTYG